MFGKAKKKTQENVDFIEFLREKNSQMRDRINNRGDDMEKSTLVWLCGAFAVIALIIGLLYIASFVMQVTK